MKLGLEMSGENVIEMSEEERIFVEKVKELPFRPMYRDGTIIDTLLVLKGLKPATELIFGVQWETDEDPKKFSEEEVGRTIETIKSLGLDVTDPIRETEPASKEEDYETIGFDQIRVFISRDQGISKELEQAYIEENDERYGQLSGFPNTAIEAYIKAEEGKDTLMEISDFPEEIRKEEFMAFVVHGYKLSKESWRDEIEVGRKWAEEIKRLHPELYRSVVSTYLKSQST